jgi:elongation factor P
MCIEVDETLYIIHDFQHVKPGKGQAFVRTKLKNLKTGAVIDKTFRAGEKVELARLDRNKMQYLYSDHNGYVFMDTNTYEQITLSEDLMGDTIKYLKENMIVEVLFHEKTPIGVEPPTFVELKIVQTDPGLRGDTATGGSKPATLETGAVVQVPLFIQVGDIIKVDTRSGEYVTRV